MVTIIKQSGNPVDVEAAEAALYKALNTQNKKLSKLDIIRVDLFLDQPYAILFNGILTLCKLKHASPVRYKPSLLENNQRKKRFQLE